MHRMHMTQTKAPQAVPALLTGIAAVGVALFLSGQLGFLLGVGAIIMGGIAYADTRSHGYTGEGVALTGAAFGAGAIVLFLLGAALI
jgi:hypothetical protein